MAAPPEVIRTLAHAIFRGKCVFAQANEIFEFPWLLGAANVAQETKFLHGSKFRRLCRNCHPWSNCICVLNAGIE